MTTTYEPYTVRLCALCEEITSVGDDNGADFDHYETNHPESLTGQGPAIGFPFSPWNEDPITLQAG